MGKKLRLNWDEQPLGQMSDADLATRLGCTAPAVRYQRVQRGIAPWLGEKRKLVVKTKKARNAKFWSLVWKTDHCWFWIGGTTRRGYGAFHYDGVKYVAHRLAWSLHYRIPWPDGKIGIHTCDIENCVNPMHVRASTDAQNMKDAIRKGRHISSHRHEPGWRALGKAAKTMYRGRPKSSKFSKPLDSRA